MPFKYLTSLRILCEHGGKPKWSIDLSLEGKSKIKKAANQDYPGIECGMSSGAQAYNVGDRLRTMAAQLLADVRPDSKFHNEIVAEACFEYGKDVREGTAPDRTFDSRAGCLFPMNRLPNENDNETITMTAVFKTAG